jgi:hypothetical protein
MNGHQYMVITKGPCLLGLTQYKTAVLNTSTFTTTSFVKNSGRQSQSLLCSRRQEYSGHVHQKFGEH